MFNIYIQNDGLSIDIPQILGSLPQAFISMPHIFLHKNIYWVQFVFFQYDDLGQSRQPALIRIVFLIFAILTPILLLNMLIAMMGNTYQQVISRSEKEWKRQVCSFSSFYQSFRKPLHFFLCMDEAVLDNRTPWSKTSCVHQESRDKFSFFYMYMRPF